MNSINVDIVNPAFMLVFMGTPIACVLLLFRCAKEGFGSADNAYAAAGSAVLLVAEFVLTLAVHIPKNDALAAYRPGSASDASTWAAYFTTWTPWNHVRMLASAATVVSCFPKRSI